MGVDFDHGAESQFDTQAQINAYKQGFDDCQEKTLKVLMALLSNTN